MSLGNISFGFLDHIQNKNLFLAFSIVIRVCTAMGESAIGASSFSLAEKQVSRENRGKVISGKIIFWYWNCVWSFLGWSSL